MAKSKVKKLRRNANCILGSTKLLCTTPRKVFKEKKKGKSKREKEDVEVKRKKVN